jgi:hypothetical protein
MEKAQSSKEYAFQRHIIEPHSERSLQSSTSQETQVFDFSIALQYDKRYLRTE